MIWVHLKSVLESPHTSMHTTYSRFIFLCWGLIGTCKSLLDSAVVKVSVAPPKCKLSGAPPTLPEGMSPAPHTSGEGEGDAAKRRPRRISQKPSSHKPGEVSDPRLPSLSEVLLSFVALVFKPLLWHPSATEPSLLWEPPATRQWQWMC